MNIEHRMSLWAAKRPKEEAAELMLEGAQEIADLRRRRDEDAQQMSALIAGYQKMQGLCIDGKYLTDAEREAIADAADRYAEITPESAETAATLRGLLARLSQPAT